MSSLYRTPVHAMVNTRSMTKRTDAQKEKLVQGTEQLPQPDETLVKAKLKTEDCHSDTQVLLEKRKLLFNQTINLDEGRSEIRLPSTSTAAAIASPGVRAKSKSKTMSKSAASSVSAHRKRLELEAAEAKARIQMELIDKKLAADLADLEKYSSQSKRTSSHSEVKKWLNRSHHELESHPVLQAGIHKDEVCSPAPPPPSAPAGTDNTVHMLPCALKDLTTANTAGGTNSKMSRLCTQRVLPSFSGDPMEWLNFHRAYQESTEVCNSSDMENLCKLRKCLHGPARDAVFVLLISAWSREKVFAMLELQFGFPDLIVSRILLDIKWLPAMPSDYHKEIDGLSRDTEWRYVPTKQNVADLATRENRNFTAFEGEWFQGPRFLNQKQELWPTDISMPEVGRADVEFVNTKTAKPDHFSCVPDPLKFESRIKATPKIEMETKPPVLDGRHPITRLITRHCHVRAARRNQKTAVHEIKQGKIRRAQPESQSVRHLRPFSHCGLDLYGPLENTVGRHRENYARQRRSRKRRRRENKDRRTTKKACNSHCPRRTRRVLKHGAGNVSGGN